MNKGTNISVLLLFLIMCTHVLFAQDPASTDVNFTIPEVALIDIEPGVNNTIYFEVDPSPESGAAPTIINDTNETLWLNYTSSQNGTSGRKISAVISSGSVPAGVSVYVMAGVYTGIGKGQKIGVRTGKKKLTKNPRTIIKNIRNCYTGDGIGNGHLLSFTMKITKQTKIKSIADANFVVTYTITDI